MFRRAVRQIVPCRSFDYDLVAGQRQRGARLHGGVRARLVRPGPVQDYTLRVTYLYRREDDEWKIIHRHGDFLRQWWAPNEGTTCGAETRDG